MERRTLEQWKLIVNQLGELPVKITNEWIDDIEKSDKGEDFWRWGFCYLDLSKCDLSGLDEKHTASLTFNSGTVWPNKEKMPKGFNPAKIIERGKTPMLGIEKLHKQGMDGSGITVAVIDSGFQSENHVEYKGSNIEVVNLFGEDISYHFHADGVLSNLCGQNIGVAPKARVIHYNSMPGGPNFTQQHLAALKDILGRVKTGEKIRAVNLSTTLGFNEDLKNAKNGEEYQRMLKPLLKPFEPLLKELQERGCEVVDSRRFGQDFTCCDIDPAKTGGFCKPSWFRTLKEDKYKELVSFACGGKVVPEFTNNTGYKYEQVSCYSWTIPQAVGMYALCLQQNPDLTWDKFAQISKNTSKLLESGVRIAQPQSIIKEVKRL